MRVSEFAPTDNPISLEQHIIHGASEIIPGVFFHTIFLIPEGVFSVDTRNCAYHSYVPGKGFYYVATNEQEVPKGGIVSETIVEGQLLNSPRLASDGKTYVMYHTDKNEIGTTGGIPFAHKEVKTQSELTIRNPSKS